MSNTELKAVIKTEDQSTTTIKKITDEIKQSGEEAQKTDSAFVDLAKALGGDLLAQAEKAWTAINKLGSGISKLAKDDAKQLAPTLGDIVQWLSKLDFSLKGVSGGALGAARAGIVAAHDAFLKLGSVDVGKTVVGWIKHFGSAEVSLESLMEIGKGLLEVLGNVAGAMGESIARAAENGDKGAQALLGGFEQLRSAVDGITGAFLEDFAPAILPVVRLFGDLAKQIADWASKSDAGKSIAKGLTDVILVMGTAFAGTIQVIIDVLIKVSEVAADAASAFSDDLANSIDVGTKGLRTFGKDWERTSSSILDSMAQVAAGQKDLTQAQIEELAKQSEAGQKQAEDAKRSAEERAKAADEELKRQIDAIKEASDLEAQIMAEASAATREGLEEDLEARQKAHDKKLELYQQEIEALQQGFQTQEEIDEQLVEILARQATDTELSVNARLAAQQKLADMSRAHSKQMSDDSKRLAEDQKKAAQDAQQKVVASYQTMFSIVKTAATDWKAALGQIWDLATKQIIDSMLKQQTAATTTAAVTGAAQASQTASVAAAQSAQGAASIASIPPKVASSFAGLGPIGLAAAAAALSFFLGMARQKIGFEDGGTVSGRVAGLGRQDSIDARLNSREAVLNERGTSLLGDAGVNALNRGQLPVVAASGGGGPMRIDLVLHMPDIPSDSELIDLIVKKMNFRVLNNGVDVVASQYVTRSGRTL